jgi:hypothetical protein
LAVLDPATLAIVERIPLPGHPEAFELAEHGQQILVNVPDVGRVVVIDRTKAKRILEWAIEPEAANFPMALDEAAHRLYVGTRRPAKLLAIDTSTGQRIATAPLCGDVDDVFLDTARARVVAVCGEGEVDEFSTRDFMGSGGVVQRTATAAGARTGLFVPSAKSLFVAVPARGSRPAQIRVFVMP